jgi:DNA uptake protein ComE-like DNA-binding protein
MERPRFALALCLCSCMIVAVLAGCTRQDNAKIQRDSDKATIEAKQDTKQLAANTKQALSSAENAVDAAADGVKQGIKSHTGPAATTSSNDSSAGMTATGKIDLNSASHDQLAALPGISDAKADAIIAGRPYDSARGVVAKGILTPAQFHRIALEVAVQ